MNFFFLICSDRFVELSPNSVDVLLKVSVVSVHVVNSAIPWSLVSLTFQIIVAFSWMRIGLLLDQRMGLSGEKITFNWEGFHSFFDLVYFLVAPLCI